MTALALPFAIGATHWLPVMRGEDVEMTCPVCAGNRRITVILGDDEHVSIPCEGCGLGYDGPRGYVLERRYEPGATEVTIESVDSMRDGKWRVATSDGTTHEFGELCATQAEALERSAVHVAENLEVIMASHCRKRQNDKHGWTVRYHRQQIAELKKKLAWHEEKVQAAK